MVGQPVDDGLEVECHLARSVAVMHRIEQPSLSETVQSAQKQDLLSGSLLKLEPMDFSGKIAIACLTP